MHVQQNGLALTGYQQNEKSPKLLLSKHLCFIKGLYSKSYSDGVALASYPQNDLNFFYQEIFLKMVYTDYHTLMVRFFSGYQQPKLAPVIILLYPS
jgi:hypothetical protein